MKLLLEFPLVNLQQSDVPTQINIQESTPDDILIEATTTLNMPVRSKTSGLGSKLSQITLS